MRELLSPQNLDYQERAREVAEKYIRPQAAELALREALALTGQPGIPPRNRFATLRALGTALHRQQRFAEAWQYLLPNAVSVRFTETEEALQ